MEAKIVVGTKTGKSYNIEAKEDLAAVFIGKRIGDTVNLTPLGLKGYEVRITGGSDKCGFPMRKDIHKTGRASALLSTRTTGYKPKRKGMRARKTVVGDIIDASIAQINTVVVKEGKDSIEKLLGLDKATGDEAPDKKAGGRETKGAPGESRKESAEESQEKTLKETPKETPKEPSKETSGGGSKETPESKPEKSSEESAPAGPKEQAR